MSASLITQLYIGYYNRAPDPAGLSYWIDIAKTQSITQIAEFFSQQAESKAAYPYLNAPNVADPNAFVNQIYLNLFNRAATDADKAYWVGQLQSGKVSVGAFIATIQFSANSAGTGDDFNTLKNKATVGLDYATKLANTNTAFTQESAKDVVSGVTKDATSVAAGTAKTDAFIAGGGGSATTYVLTTGTDNVPGTAGNDTIVGSQSGTAASNTLTISDVINGGAGKDKLLFTSDLNGPPTLPAASITNVEYFYLRNVGVGTLTVDFGTITGEEQVWNDRSSAAVDVGNLAVGTVVGVQGDGGSTVSATTAGYVATATAASLVLNGGTASTNASAITVNGAGLTSASIKSQGGSNTFGAINLGGTVKTVAVEAQTALKTTGITGGGIETITVTGAGAADIGALAASVKSLDASAASGGVTATLNAKTDISVKGSTGNDVFTTAAVLAGSGLVDAGDGTADRLVVASGAHITADAGKLYKGFEQLQVQDTVTVAVGQLAGTNTIDTIRINDGGGATGVTGLSAAQAGNVQILAANATGAITIGLTGATASGQIDTVKAALTTTTTAGAAQAIDISGIVLAGVEKLELTGNGKAVGTTGAVTLTTSAAQALDSIKLVNVANGNSIVIDAAHSGTNLTIDVSGSGGTTVNANAYNTTTGTKITGGIGDDTLLGSRLGDVIVGGDGDDQIRGEAVNLAGVVTPAVGKTSEFTLDTKYDVGDKVQFTFGVTNYEATVTAGNTSAAQVWALLKAVNNGGTLAAALTAANVTDTVTGQTLKLVDNDTGTGAGNFTAALTTTLDIRDTQKISVDSLDANDLVSLVVGGNSYTFKVTADGQINLADAANTAPKAAIEAASGGTLSFTNTAAKAGDLSLLGNVSGTSLTNVVTSTGGNFGGTSTFQRNDGVNNLAGTTDNAATYAETVKVAAANDVLGTVSLGNASDTLTGGAGKDAFVFVKGSLLTQIDTITDLNLGSNVVAGQVDSLRFQANAGTTSSLVTLTDAQQSTVTSQLTLAAAVNSVLTVAGSAGAATRFTYGADTYLAVNGDGNGTFDAASDYVVKVTGVTGTLDASDITFFVN